ncbi:YggT family protein [Evansella caseinilytica]|uniref:YggT family protein n=1 Tax=Evansella caseinilytica TaxID=1503961 RepID=A0A1H3MFV2_9BACI|nr:YggT family protein [Evansella caseinilytica]SDY75453.1 YggT family protein [Evansella caseinilytica]
MAYLERFIINIMTIYLFLTIIYIFMSWFPNSRETSFGRLIGRLVEPYLTPFRQIIPPLGMIDISPIVAIFVLNLAMSGVSFIFRMLG